MRSRAGARQPHVGWLEAGAMDQVDEARVRVGWSEERDHVESGEPAGYGLVGFVELEEVVVVVVHDEISAQDRAKALDNEDDRPIYFATANFAEVRGEYLCSRCKVRDD